MTTTKGFTLIELLVVIVIFGGIMAALMVAFLISESSYHTADSYVQVQQEARRAFDAMVKELREAGWDATNKPTVPGCAGCGATGDRVWITNAGTYVLNNTAGNRIDFQVALGYDLSTTVTGCPIAAVCWGAQNPLNPAQPNQANWSVRYWIDTSIPPTFPRLVRDVFDQNGVVQDGAGGTASLRRILANGVDATGITTFTYPYLPGTITPAKTVKITLGIQEQAQVTGGKRTLSIGVAPMTPNLETLVKLRNN